MHIGECLERGLYISPCRGCLGRYPVVVADPGQLGGLSPAHDHAPDYGHGQAGVYPRTWGCLWEVSTTCLGHHKQSYRGLYCRHDPTLDHARDHTLDHPGVHP